MQQWEGELLQVVELARWAWWKVEALLLKEVVLKL